ncbi:MAG: sigma 54-interacting transcriptional regulator, partial [Nitrospirales bacterium]
ILGHEKGAFTGAVERRAGCFELAHGGTIFLDEVAEMGPSIQAKFLRIIQDGMVRRIGGKSEIKVDVRVLAATNKDPIKALRDGLLREDLYYRLNVFTLALPTLRERREDIPLMIEAFIEEFNAKYEKRIRSVDEEALRILMSHPWPGNVRELRNTIERASIMCSEDLISPAHLPQLVTTDQSEPVDGSNAIRIAVGSTVEDAEKQLILRTLASVNNNKTKAAEILGISLKTLHNRLHQYHA